MNINDFYEEIFDIQMTLDIRLSVINVAGNGGGEPPKEIRRFHPAQDYRLLHTWLHV